MISRYFISSWLVPFMNERFNIFYTFWQNGCYDNMTQAILKIFKLKVAQLNFVKSYIHQSLLITQTKV